MKNVRQTVISQYANSPVMLAIIDAFNEAIDPSTDLDAFYDQVWNINTAKGFGLDIWGRIVGVSRTLMLALPTSSFGFKDGVNDFLPFGQAPFVTSKPLTQTYKLSDPVYRKLILIKAMANISACTPRLLNKLLTSLFSGGRCYVNEQGPMMMRYTFEFYLSASDLAILTQSGLTPKPATVAATVLQLPPKTTFGFASAGPESSSPFGQLPMLSASAPLAIAANPEESLQATLDNFQLDVNVLA